MLSLRQGGYMTPTQFAMIFWYDLATSTPTGTITTAIISWWRNRK